jgi:cytochrome c oxidase cbb3-type subunit 3
MSKTPTILTSAASFIFIAALSCVYLKPALAHSQESDQQGLARTAPSRNSHDFLGLGPAPDAAAAKLGEPLYKENCSTCHGPTARGAQGPNLVRSVLVLHDQKGEEIGQVVQNGRPQGGMPAFTNLNDNQIYDIVEYIHLQVELAANRGLYIHSNTMNSGDSEKGKAFFAANCATCHSVTGDLATVGARYPQPAAMLARIAWPTTGELRRATVTTQDGKILTGTLIHYDDFETILRTAAGAVNDWSTPTVKVDITNKLAGHRTLLPKYTDDDLHNLTQYLLTLK